MVHVLNVPLIVLNAQVQKPLIVLHVDLDISEILQLKMLVNLVIFLVMDAKMVIIILLVQSVVL